MVPASVPVLEMVGTCEGGEAGVHAFLTHFIEAFRYSMEWRAVWHQPAHGKHSHYISGLSGSYIMLLCIIQKAWSQSGTRIKQGILYGPDH